MGKVKIPVHALPPSDVTDVPTVGTIKRALHELSREPSCSAHSDGGAVLREAHELLRRLARRNGIDPDAAIQRQLTAVKLLRERLLLASATAANPTSG